MPEKRRTTECLVLSPATRFGSWGWLADVMKFSPDHLRYRVVAFGKPEDVPHNATVHSLPDINYVKVGSVMARKGMLALNALIYLPLIPLLTWTVARHRPRHLIANGVAAAAMLLIVKFLTGAKLHLAYHGYIAHMGGVWHKLIKIVVGRCDHVIVNSKGSRDDLALVLDPERIVVVEHWAAPTFFEMPLMAQQDGPLRVLYVGRLNEDKFAQCQRVMKKLSTTGTVEFWLVGDGPMLESAQQIDNAIIRGYVSGRKELATIYQSVDLVWTPADITYLSRPGIEALASGTRVIVGDVPAVQGRVDTSRIPTDLVSPPIGHVVDGELDDEAEALLQQLSAQPRNDDETRRACRAYALTNHSVENIRSVTELFETPG